MTRLAKSSLEVVTDTLESYARRGVFRGFSPGAARNGTATFKMVWHHQRPFELLFDARKNTMRFPLVLPGVPANSTMYRELKQFIKSRQSDEWPEHRRIDSRKAHIQVLNRGGNVALTLRVLDGDVEYGTRKLVHLVHEIFMTFLLDGNYYDYLVETFDLDPDRM